MEEKIILKRHLFPLPHPLEPSIVQCCFLPPIYFCGGIWVTGWQAGADGGFCSLPLRWLTGGGVSLRLSWMKSNMWTSRTHSCASVAHSRNDTVDPKAVWPLVMKSLLFLLPTFAPSCTKKRLRFMIYSDLCHQPSCFPILIDSAGTRCIVLLLILDIQWTPAARDWFCDQLQL